MYLLDTDTCIHIARGGAILKKLRKKRSSDLRISIHTVYELEVGILKATLHQEAKRQALTELMRLFDVADFGVGEAREAACIRAELEKIGKPIGSIDYLIAGTARFQGWTVVTGNLDEFNRVKNLKVQRWH